MIAHLLSQFVLLLGHFACAQTSRLENVQACLLDPGCQKLVVAAHRQGYKDTFENSLWAVRQHLGRDTDMLEIDVRETWDGRLILMHDSKVDRTTNGTGRVRSMTFEQLKRLRIRGLQEAPPTLEDVVELAAGRVLLFIDIKAAPVEKVWRSVKSRGMARQAILFIDNSGEYSEMNDLLRSGEDVLFMPRLRQKDRSSPEELMGLFYRMPRFVHIDDEGVPPAVIEAIRSRQAHVYRHFPAASSTAGLRAAAIPLILQGVHFFDHDAPQKVYEALADYR